MQSKLNELSLMIERAESEEDVIFVGSQKPVPTASTRGSPWRGVSKNCSKW